MKSRLKKIMGKRGVWLSVAFIVSFVACVCMANVFINALTAKFGWYFYTEPKYEHTIGDSSYAVFSDVDKSKKTDIFFCMPSEELKSSAVYSLVWETANQFADKYDFVNQPKTLNLYTLSDSEKLSGYIYDEGGVEVNKVNRESVIIDCGGKYRVVTLSDFFTLDNNQYITDYRGEEVMTYLIKYVMSDSHKKILFTANHGEQSTEALLYLLMYSGYEVNTVDLTSEEIADDTDFIFIVSPIYDFEKVKEGSSVRSEIEKLEEYANGGGRIVVVKDPYSQKLSNLEGMLDECGMGVNYGIVSGGTESLTVGGRSVVASVADNAKAEKIAQKLVGIPSRIIVSDSGSIDVSDGATALLVTGEGAKTDLFDGGIIEGGQVLCATSDIGEGSITLFLSPKTFSASYINSDAYGNRAFLYSMVEVLGGNKTPVGATLVPFESTYLENLTVKESNKYAAVLIGIVPLVIIALGAVVLIRRKHR